MSQSPITKIWVMELRSGTTSPLASNPDLRELLQEILRFCYYFSSSSSPGTSTISPGSRDATHQIWEDIDASTRRLVMITGYPSAALNLEADREYVKRGYLQKMGSLVESKLLVQVEASAGELPLEDGEGLVVEIGPRKSGRKAGREGSTEQGEDMGTGDEYGDVDDVDGVIKKNGVEIEKGVVSREVCVSFSNARQALSIEAKDEDEERPEKNTRMNLRKVMG